MPFPKKKKKKSLSPQLEYLRKQREQEWDDIMKGEATEGLYTKEEKREFKKLQKKYGN